jgi:1,4-dihydroxy-2-naphthoate octaprenyltransferase
MIAPGILLRALRLPFCTASVLPYLAGALLPEAWAWDRFLLGLGAVLLTHLSANLMNDYADSRSGVDWQDLRHWGLFGGSKLIQEGVLTERFYLAAAGVTGGLALACVLGLALLLGRPETLLYFAAILALGWSYSHPPLRLSHRGLGEVVIFLTFGPACVMGGVYAVTGAFPTWEGFVVSVPFGLFTTAVLFANEVPDYPADIAAGKRTWVHWTRPGRAWILYAGLCLAGGVSIPAAVGAGALPPGAAVALLALPAGAAAARILRRHPWEKAALVRASALTVGLQAVVGVALVLAAGWKG